MEARERGIRTRIGIVTEIVIETGRETFVIERGVVTEDVAAVVAMIETATGREAGKF